MFNKEALEYLVKLGEDENPIISLDEGIFSTKVLNRVTAPMASSIRVSTLTGLVDYIKTNIDGLNENLLIHIKSHEEVKLISKLNKDKEREVYISANAILPNNIRYNDFLEVERFNIMLQSSFVDNENKEILLKYTGLIMDDEVKTTGDDGVSQQVTIKTGIATVGQAIVPNPVILAPYRTFPEIEQPESKFIFRMRKGPSAAIFEADGGAWRNKAIENIRDYLKEKLKDVKTVEIIA